MKNLKRVLSAVLALCMIITLLPNMAFASHDSTGKPLDLENPLYLAIYIGGTEFPGEPSTHESAGYFTLEAGFVHNAGAVAFASKADGLLKEQILDDVVEGNNSVWGVFSTTGGSHYLTEASGLVNADGTHNAQTEATIIQAAVDNNKFTLGEGKTVSDYAIIWYVIKYQMGDQAWHVDGMIVEKDTVSVNYYGNGNTAGEAPDGVSGLAKNTEYTILGNTKNLQKTSGSDTYIFSGWNTATDGTGTHYDEGDTVTLTEDLTLYAEWYLENKYTITVETKLDGDIANVESILGEDTTVWVSTDGVSFAELEKSITGTYVTTVTKNGTYYVYYKDAQGNYTQTDRQVTIFDHNGHGVLDYYTVSYDTASGSWAEGQDPGVTNHYTGSAVSATANVPTREGYTFTGWLDQLGNVVESGGRITAAIDQKTTLTAQWEKNIDLTVKVTLNHGGNIAADKHEAALELLCDGVLLEAVTYDENTVGYSYDTENDVTTYTVTYTDLAQGSYTANPFKSGYQILQNTHQGASSEDQTIDIVLEYSPESFDLEFRVKTEFTDETAHLIPRSVNVNVAYWNGQSWETFPEQTQPVPVRLDADGTGTGVYTVYGSYAAGQPYAYRLEVASFQMPDGRTVSAAAQETVVTYVSVDSDLYTASITVEPENSGAVPTYGTGSTTLSGAYLADGEQNGVPTATISMTPHTVTFEANDGLLQGQQTLVLENQYSYPDLESYVPVANDGQSVLEGWYLDAALTQRAENLARQYLNGDVTYYAKYSPPMTVQGTVTVEGTYTVNGQQVQINAIDKAKEAVVVLQRKLGDSFVEVRSQLLSFGTYEELGSAEYLFENVPNDGSEYRIQILVNNYACTYDNESDADISWSDSEYTAVLGDDNVAVVDAYLEFAPDVFEILLAVDSSRIAADFRPDSALSRILYRDLGDIHPYSVLAEHTVAPYGVTVTQDENGHGVGSITLWRYHTDGTPYEYQMDVTTLYGDVDGVFTATGTAYNSDTAPYTIEYGAPVRYSEGATPALLATMIPKKYEVIFEMGLADGEDVQGMDHFFTDDGLGGEYYSALHTWSRTDEIMAFPYREGYVFLGWQPQDEGVTVTDHGYVTVDAAVAQNVTLVAQWQKLEDTDYTVRHLERYTDKVLNGAQVVTGSTVGSRISANLAKATIDGYTYVGAKIGGVFYEEAEDPQLTITTDPTQNVITLYYVPEDSPYVEQVESNLHLDKTAQLTDDGSYTITLEAFTTGNPVTTTVPMNQPMDVVLVLNQSDTLAQNNYEYLQSLKDAVSQLAKDLAANSVEHRMAIVGFADNADGNWEGTGLFDSTGTFQSYDDLDSAAYSDALMPVTVGSSVNPALTMAADSLTAVGDTYTQYGIEMANNIFAQTGTDSSRVRVMILFTADYPGGIGYEETEANAAIAKAYITKNTYSAKCYTIGYVSSGFLVEDHPASQYMHGISSNYPNAQSLGDVYTGTTYSWTAGVTLNGATCYYIELSEDVYVPLTWGVYNANGDKGWYYANSSGGYTLLNETLEGESDSLLEVLFGSGTAVYERTDGAYKTGESGHYSTAAITELTSAFQADLTAANTQVSTGVTLGEDTMLRDILGQGLVLPQGAQVTAYSVAGTYNATEDAVTWSDSRTQLAQLTVDSTDKTENGITVQNLTAANATDPAGSDYLPHTVEYTGFDFSANYLNESKTSGYKLVLEITGVEATDDVQYGRPVFTNSDQSGVLMAADSEGNRQLLMRFDAPSTIFIQRAYVLDYGKPFTLSGWYLTADDAGNGAVHLDCDVENGMNRFDAAAPNRENSADSAYGNTSFGNVSVNADKTVTYTPVTAAWAGWDQFYVFGSSARRAVLAQDANENGNLWHKVTVIPANNVYYEDSFVTSAGTNGANGFAGFTFTGSWETDGDANGNMEQPELQESTGSGVHGWTDDLADDTKYTDGSAHYTAVPGAAVEFTFTGTGVDVYSRTNSEAGMVMATLYHQTDDSWTAVKGIIMDNLSVSGDYYSVPVIAFQKLPYGSYKVLLRAVQTSDAATGTERCGLWIDGARVYNPTGMTQNYDGSLVQEAYGDETNAVFTAVRDILLQNGSFDAGTGISGAVFIDQVDGEVGVSSYELGNYESDGPKNEVYLSPGQAIVLKVDPANNYYIGLKSLTGVAVTANISGTDINAVADQIALTHTADLYYKVTPVDGYLVIQNNSNSGGVLSVTRLRTTNADTPVEDGGILPVTQQQALMLMNSFSLRMEAPQEDVPEQPSVAEQIAAQLKAFAKELFTSVRVWLDCFDS